MKLNMMNNICLIGWNEQDAPTELKHKSQFHATNRPLLWSFYGVLVFFATNRSLLTELLCDSCGSFYKQIAPTGLNSWSYLI